MLSRVWPHTLMVVGPAAFSWAHTEHRKAPMLQIPTTPLLSTSFLVPPLMKAAGGRERQEEPSGLWRFGGREMFGQKPGTGGGLVSPCAACKLLRRKCAADCIFAPYFPADEPQKFATVHRVFGASNVNKLLQEVPVEQRSDAVSSLVYEANARVRDPVYGCVAAISSLQRQIDALHAQLAIAQAEMVRIHLYHAAYLARSTAATVSIAPFIGEASTSAATTPSENADDIAAEKPQFGYDALLEHAHVGQPMWSY